MPGIEQGDHVADLGTHYVDKVQLGCSTNDECAQTHTNYQQSVKIRHLVLVGNSGISKHACMFCNDIWRVCRSKPMLPTVNFRLSAISKFSKCPAGLKSPLGPRSPHIVKLDQPFQSSHIRFQPIIDAFMLHLHAHPWADVNQMTCLPEFEMLRNIHCEQQKILVL